MNLKEFMNAYKTPEELEDFCDRYIYDETILLNLMFTGFTNDNYKVTCGEFEVLEVKEVEDDDSCFEGTKYYLMMFKHLTTQTIFQSLVEVENGEPYYFHAIEV